jgi:ferredoxin-nitrite reductase
VNRIEALKAARVRFARGGWRTIGDDDKERLKWVGVFHRKPTPGHFMMRIRMPNGVLGPC